MKANNTEKKCFHSRHICS